MQNSFITATVYYWNEMVGIEPVSVGHTAIEISNQTDSIYISHAFSKGRRDYILQDDLKYNTLLKGKDYASFHFSAQSVTDINELFNKLTIMKLTAKYSLKNNNCADMVLEILLLLNYLTQDQYDKIKGDLMPTLPSNVAGICSQLAASKNENNLYSADTRPRNTIGSSLLDPLRICSK